VIPARRAIRSAIAAAMLLAVAALPAAAGRIDDRLRSLGDEFLAHSMRRAPHEATRLGQRESDGLLAPVTRTSLAEDLAWLRGFRAKVASLPGDRLSGDGAVVRHLLMARVERRMLELEVIRPFERDPGAYLPLVAGSIESVLERPAASPCQRLRLATRRLAQVPEVLRAARINLRDPPRELTEIALALFPGVLRFYRETVPRLAAGCRDARTQADLAQADTAAVRAVEAFLDYLREDLLPASRGTLAIGPEACRRLLRLELLEEHADGNPPEPMDSILARAAALVEERRSRLDALAPGRVRPALEALTSERPETGELVPYVEQRLEEVREFLGQREIVTLPAVEGLAVRAAPGFRAALALTGLDAPGPWESKAPDAWLEVAPADSAWDEWREEMHLARFHRRDAELAVIHDGLPGCFLRGLALRGRPDRLRQALQGAWPAESWGEYCEQMMIDEGYGSWDPGTRLAAAARALRHAGRSYAALALHAGAMSVDQARAMLQSRCLLDPDEAGLEIRRAAADPAAMGYTFGARQLLELRDEARRVLGPRFRIRVFNDAVLRHGASPAGLVRLGVRRELGGDDDPTPVGARP
jgi:uncharacterized protein (DUF885 family)